MRILSTHGSNLCAAKILAHEVEYPQKHLQAMLADGEGYDIIAPPTDRHSRGIFDAVRRRSRRNRQQRHAQKANGGLAE